MEQAAAQDPWVSTFLAPLLALAQVEAGKKDEARLRLDQFAAEDFALPLDTMWLSGMVAYAEVASECRMPRWAEPLLELLRPWAHQLACSGAMSTGPVSHFLGGLAAVLNHYEAAENYFVQAQTFNERAGARHFAARTDLAYGRMLLERHHPGDSEKARSLLATAHSVARANGYRSVEGRAATALERLG
jgi:hypothetical protein